MVPRFLVGLVSSLVQGHRGDGKLHRLDIDIHERLSGRESLAERAHGRDVRRVHAHERARGEGAVEGALCGRYLRSGICSGSGEVNHAAAGRLDGLDGRRARIVRQHKRGPFRVQVGVAVLDESESRTDIRECEGIASGAGEKNKGRCDHCGVSFRDGRGIKRLNCYKYIILSVKVSGIIVPD